MQYIKLIRTLFKKIDQVHIQYYSKFTQSIAKSYLKIYDDLTQ